MKSGNHSLTMDDISKRERLIKESARELEALVKHHRDLWRENLLKAYQSRAAAAHGIDVGASSRMLSQRLETHSLELRSSGNGEAV